MVKTKILSLSEIEQISYDALLASGASDKNARALAVATAETEAMGVASHGLAYIPVYAEHLRCGKVDGQACPIVTHPKPSFLHVDAGTGFAHPAIALGFEKLIPLARTQGVALLSIYNSYNCGVLGVHTHKLACEGLVGLGFTNAPASIAPSGGRKAVVGTNPFSIAVPGEEEPAILVDQSASAIAKSEVMKYAREGKAIPLGWALDSEGQPTEDAEKGLKGSMAPSGRYKGVGIALMVEILAAALSGANLGIDASPFSGPVGGPPKTGQCFIAIDPNTTRDTTDKGLFHQRITDLVAAFHVQEGARLPGEGRGAKWKKAQTAGVSVSIATLERIEKL